LTNKEKIELHFAIIRNTSKIVNNLNEQEWIFFQCHAYVKVRKGDEQGK
jgi:hypothetical protein